MVNMIKSELENNQECKNGCVGEGVYQVPCFFRLIPIQVHSRRLPAYRRPGRTLGRNAYRAPAEASQGHRTADR
jgi:hypothetical protein